MSMKKIKTWINGAVREIEVEDIVTAQDELSVEDRLNVLEDKPIITDGNFLVGDGTEDFVEMTPEEVLSHINGASVTTLTTEEYNALEETNANTLYMLTDSDENYVTAVTTTGSGNAITAISQSGNTITATKGATYIPTSQKGVASGVATLDTSGKVPTSQLPSYVDDVIEGTYSSATVFKNASGTTLTGETGKIYVDTATNKTYRWSGSAYIEISASLALGTTSSTAYYGDKGKVAYDHSQKTSGNPHGVTKSDVGLGSVVNTGDSATPVSGGTTKFTTGGAYTELAKKVDKVSGKGLSTNDYTTAEKNKLAGIAEGANAYTLPAAGSSLGGVKSGGDVTISSGVITVNDDSHNHTIANVDGLQTALDGKAATHSHPYLPLAGGTMNDGATIKLSTYGTRSVTLSGNSITADMSKETGGWAGSFASVKDPSSTTTTMLGWYGGASGLTHIFMGGTYSDPAMKMTPAGQFTFKNTPKVGDTNVALATNASTSAAGLMSSTDKTKLNNTPTFSFDSTTGTLTITTT